MFQNSCYRYQIIIYIYINIIYIYIHNFIDSIDRYYIDIDIDIASIRTIQINIYILHCLEYTIELYRYRYIFIDIDVDIDIDDIDIDDIDSILTLFELYTYYLAGYYR